MNYDTNKYVTENKRNLRKNHEGYDDPTASDAINNAMKNEKSSEEDYVRFHKFIGLIFRICEMTDFEIQDRLTIVDKRTGRIWK